MDNSRMAGQMLNVTPSHMAAIAAAAAGLTYGVPALLAHLHGRRAGAANPQHGGIPGTVGYSLGGGLIGGPVGAGLSGLAYNTGHQAGRQYATDHMLGPGYDANMLNWQRLPGT